MSFKNDFMWGTATASFQVEGGAFEDGKGLNIWDVFSHTPGKVYEGHNGDVACDHYHRLDEDLDIMKSLGVNSYRFSVSWPRIMPDGEGAVNPKGIEFYNRLIDGLVSRGIRPCMTLYHWDLPYALHLKGGWLNDGMPDIFAAYARVIKENFGDRVHDFITFNEPQVFVGCGYFEGKHAPGYRLPKAELLRIGHNVLKAHGKAVTELRKGEPCKIGLSCASQPAIPVSDGDRDAARESYFQSNHPAFAFSDAYWLDPIVYGKYPEWVYDCKDIGAPKITGEDMKLISQPIDFIGMNIYVGRYVKAGANGAENVKQKIGMTRNSIGWAVTPEALYWGPYFYYERYKKPIIITENGMACHDCVSLDGKVHDPNRTDYLQRYLQNFKKAAEDGVEANGYFVWSFMDNFEWADGYNERFGIVYCDYETQNRIVKDSGYWYKEIIASNGEKL